MPFDDDFAAADALLAEAFGVSVTYHRGEASIGLVAVVGSTRFEAEMEDGRVVESESRDYLVAPGDLVLDGEPVEPRRGDRIVETIGGEETLFEVAAPAGEPVWQWIDPARLQMRIHTKQIEDAEQ